MKDLIENDLGVVGRIISPSKGRYIFNNPNHAVIFNANLISKELGKLWHGDLDLTIDGDKVWRLADKLNTEIWVLPENAATSSDIEPDYSQAVVRFNREEVYILCHSYYIQNDTIVIKPSSEKPIADKHQPLPIDIDKKYIVAEIALRPDRDINYNPKNASPEECPFTYYQRLIIDVCEASGLDKEYFTNPSNSMVSINTYRKLSKALEKWFELFDPCDSYSVQKKFTMLILCYAPMATDAFWAQDDVIYLVDRK